MPYKNEDTLNGSILKNKIYSLQSIYQRKIFASIVSNYSETLSKDELDYLDSIATKAEYFFSLGIPEQDFQKSQDLKLNGLVILVDTNFIYSVLGLHSHRQNENCNEIIKLISNKKLDCRLVFIKKTLTELQNKKIDFERGITTESLTHNQIKSLIDSENLSSFAKDYFEKKLIDPDTPHPAEKIKYSQKILKSNKIEIYNYQFPHLEEQSYINAKFQEYYDYHNLRNEIRLKQGFKETQLKDDKKLEHDIYLREAVISLRKEKNKLYDINYICLTLDKGLISFDSYANGKRAINQETLAPNFILPSVFLRKIRPFIPVITDDYKKAFISSITANTIDTSLPQVSEAVQRSMTYFKKLGIDDYELIMTIIKQELFFTEFIESEKEERQEEFIRSELDKAYEKLRCDKELVERKLAETEKQGIDSVLKEQKKKEELFKEFESATSSFKQIENELTNKIEEISKEKYLIECTKSEDYIAHKELLLKEKNKVLNEKDIVIEPLHNQALNRFLIFKFVIAVIVIIYFVILEVLKHRIGWNSMEPIFHTLEGLGIVLGVVFMCIYGEHWNPLSFFSKRKSEILMNTYEKFKFDIKGYEMLKREIVDLENEIKEIKTAHNKRYKT